MKAKANRCALNRHDRPHGEARTWRRPQRKLRIAGWALAATLAAGGANAATIQDSANRSVEVPSEVTAVVPAGAPAQVLLQALAPDALAGLVEPFKPEHVIYVDPKLASLPQIPMLTRTAAPGDVAMVAALKPGLVIDYGNASARYAAADEKIAKELSVPALLFGGSLADVSRVAKTIGNVIAHSRADVVAATADDVLAKVKPLADLADSEKVAVYLGRSTDGLTGARAGTSFDEPIRLAGGRNIVESGNGTFVRLSVPDLVALKPAVVILAERDALATLRTALPKETIFVLDAGEPYKVLTGPPSINRLAGLAALAAILHPDKMHIAPDDVTRIETRLFPIPPGLAMPAPLQVMR